MFNILIFLKNYCYQSHLSSFMELKAVYRRLLGGLASRRLALAWCLRPMPWVQFEYFQSHFNECRLVHCRLFFHSFLAHLLHYLFVFQTGEKLFELHAHNQKITALAAFPLSEACDEKCHMILTAGADRTVVVSFCLNILAQHFDR